MPVHYLDHEDAYGGTLIMGNRPAIGLVKAVNPVTGRVSGVYLDMTRNFDNAFVVMDGGMYWGTSYLPQVGDAVQILINVNNAVMVKPFSINYGSATKDVDTAAQAGFKSLIPGELHTHSYGHAETLLDSVGDQFITDGMGDFISLESSDGAINMRAWHKLIQSFGFNADGTIGVSVFAGNSEVGGAPYTYTGNSAIPNPALYRLISTGSTTFLAGPNAAQFESSLGTLDDPSLVSRRKFETVFLETVKKADGTYVLQAAGNSINFTPQGIQFVDVNGNKITLSSTGIVVQDTKGNSITMNASGLAFVSGTNQTTIGGGVYEAHEHTGNLGFPTSPPISGT